MGYRSQTYRVYLKGQECSFASKYYLLYTQVTPPYSEIHSDGCLAVANPATMSGWRDDFLMSISSWMALSTIHRLIWFKSTAKIELRFHTRVWSTRGACRANLPTNPPIRSVDSLIDPFPRRPGARLDQPTVSPDLDSTAK
jgi:hypothetical protein